MTEQNRTIHTSSTERTERLGRILGELVAANDVIVLTGDLGAGKTHLAKGVARGVGSPTTATSPTFNILVVHDGGRLTLNHLDLYRLERPEELVDIDFYDVIESGRVTLVEWGDRFDDVVNLADLTVSIEITDDDTRDIALTPLSPRGVELADSLARGFDNCHD